MAIATEHHRVVVLGAGFNGLIAAKTYLQLKPSADLLILDNESTIGGVWSASRIYPGLLYETPSPLTDFPDMSMCKELGIGMWEDITAYQINEFLMLYVKKHDLERRCRLKTEVTGIERHGTGWQVSCRPTGDEKTTSGSIICDKLIVATGISSKPSLPPYDMSNYEGTWFHSIELGRRLPELLTSDIQHVTVIGGHKTALEVVGLCSQAVPAKKVEWLIKPDGGGPTWMMPAKNPDGSPMAKMATKRVVSYMAPSVYGSSKWFNRFLYSNRWSLGTWFSQFFWKFMTKMILSDKYTKSENGRKLKPQPDTIFYFAPGGTITHDRDLETLRLIDEEELIRVDREILVSAEGHTATISSGEKINTDAIVFCTGWKLSAPPLFSPALANELGLPTDMEVLSEQEKKYWGSLDSAAETAIEEAYPILRTPPPNIFIRDTKQTQYRLFHSLVPSQLAACGDRSILFLGNYATGKTPISGQIKSLWGVAYLEGLLPASTQATLSNKDEMDQDIAHVEAYRRKRYLNAYKYRLSIFETEEFHDQLLRELGVRSDRKRMKIPSGWRDLFGLRSACAELFEGYFARDYEGIVDEFLATLDNRPEA